MGQAATLNRIGTRVKGNIDNVRDRIPSTLLKKLSKDARGKIVGYKMTDGYGIGLVLELEDGSTNWFFDDEINRA